MKKKWYKITISNLDSRNFSLVPDFENLFLALKSPKFMGLFGYKAYSNSYPSEIDYTPEFESDNALYYFYLPIPNPLSKFLIEFFQKYNPEETIRPDYTNLECLYGNEDIDNYPN